MPSCIPATDADLIAAWPGVVIRAGERWLVTVDPDLVETGAYTVTMGGLPFAYTAAVPPDDATAVVAGLLVPLGAQVLAAASQQGAAGILLQEMVPPPPAQPAGLAVTAMGPAEGSITATLVSGGDSNAADRARWLADVLCDLPACCLFARCPGDYTRMHAALAAHWLYQTAPANIGQTGTGASDFESMRLGPASLTRGKSQWGAKGAAADADLATTVPGRYFLSLRRKYIFPVVCA